MIVLDLLHRKTAYKNAITTSDEKKYPNVSTLIDDVDLRDYCNFNQGNNAPVFTSDSSFTINEGETAITTLSATDADGDPVTYGSTSDGDSSYFAVNQTTGALSFTNAPDYEAPGDSNTDNVYTFAVTATDGFNTTEQVISVTVSNINDTAPAFVTDASFSAAENQTAVGTVLTTDADGDDLTFTI